MAYLYDHKGKALKRTELLDEVWGYEYGESNVVDARVRALRKKLGEKA